MYLYSTMKKIITLLFVILFIVVTSDTFAQCPMCKASASHSEYAKSLNTGILYLLAFPFVTLGAVALIWMKNKEKFK
jgi:hypothetical protein